MKNLIIFLIVLSVISTFGATAAFAGSSSLIEQGEACLQKEPPEYEKAAQLFQRAGLQGDGEGYYRLGEMYEKGLLTIGNPCTDDLSALGKQKAEECYVLAAQNGYEVTTPGWRSITQDEAKEMMAKDDGHVIVDVRRQDEYDTGHIPGAILIPNESISDTRPEELPDLDQIILVYCRSGNRSKQASQKLADMGYSNVYEFGGINTWDGGIETKATAVETASSEEWDMSVSTEITETVRKLFDKAMEEFVGVDYTPVAVLGAKNDTYCILCKATAVYPGAEPYNVLMYINEDGIQNIYELWIEKHAEKETVSADGT